MTKIVIEKAGKRIKDTVIFEDISISCEEGKIYGLVGRNGAGKTMLMKSICGLTSLTSGSIIVDDKRIGVDVEIPESIGVIIEVPGFIPYFSGFDNLKYLANLKKKVDSNRIREVLKIVNLDPDSKKHVSKYSLGMRQRLGIAQAIMENPDILLLDEPMNGLDNDGVAEVKELLKSFKKQGKTIILASHHMEDIDELCDEVFKMDKGRIITD
ncbi:MAG: ATP-binding cassette domain-containing protein [Clostridia bacterium]|nr:ATP-binding cassette domain-containing protein [Clostridia bacterium]